MSQVGNQGNPTHIIDCSGGKGVAEREVPNSWFDRNPEYFAPSGSSGGGKPFDFVY